MRRPALTIEIHKLPAILPHHFTAEAGFTRNARRTPDQVDGVRYQTGADEREQDFEMERTYASVSPYRTVARSTLMRTTSFTNLTSLVVASVPSERKPRPHAKSEHCRRDPSPDQSNGITVVVVEQLVSPH